MIILSCPIHLDYISSDQQPVALPCGHVFCTPCLDRLYGETRLKPCPLCNKATKKASFLKLYALDSSSQPGSPSGSPVKREGARARASDIAMEGGRIRDALRGLCSVADESSGSGLNNTVLNTAVDATQRMATFSEKVATTSEDIELKCLAHQLRDASSRFQSLLFPQLETLLNLRETIETLTSQNLDLQGKLNRREVELDVISRKRRQQEREKANLILAKKLVDERLVGLEKALDATHEKLKTAQQESVVQKESICVKDEELAKFRVWLGEHKHKAEKYKAEVRRLQETISEMEKSTPSESSKPQLPHPAPRRPRPQVASGDTVNMIIDLDEDGTADDDEYTDVRDTDAPVGIRPRKRQRIDPGSDFSAFTIDLGPDISAFTNATASMIGQWKPPAIAKVVTNFDRKKDTKQNVPNPILPLHLDSRGQTKVPYALGSRVRMGRST